MAGEQMSLDLGPPPPPEIVYFALRPDIVAARKMIEIGRWCRARDGRTARLYGPDRLHVSLVQVISWRGFRRGDVAAAHRAAARIRTDPFIVSFDRLSTFGGGDRRPVVLCSDDGAAALTGLRNTLRNELLKAGLRHGPAQFRPHVTLFWDRRPVREASLEEPVRWTVEDFVLVRSLVGRSRHVDLARWPLRRQG